MRTLNRTAAVVGAIAAPLILSGCKRSTHTGPGPDTVWRGTATAVQVAQHSITTGAANRVTVTVQTDNSEKWPQVIQSFTGQTLTEAENCTENHLEGHQVDNNQPTLKSTVTAGTTVVATYYSIPLVKNNDTDPTYGLFQATADGASAGVAVCDTNGKH